MPNPRLVVCMFPVCMMLFGAGAVCGQQYPVKPIRFIVGSAAGGGTDFVARLMAHRLTEVLGQQIIVENRPGAGSSLAYEFGVKAAPDGYTLTMITPSYAIIPSLYPMKYDPLNDFTSVIQVARGPFVLVVHPSLPAKTTRELIALAKARPGQIIYGSSGQGAIVHLTTELFLYMAGVRMTHVPYKGGGPALTDLIAGQISLVFATSQTGLPQVKAGRLRALAVTTPERIPAEPNLPTVAESGVPGYEVTNWHGLIGPKGLPRAVVNRMHDEVANLIKLKDMEDRLQADGMSPAGGTSEQFYEQIRKELDQWRQVVTRARIKIN
ncbi:MAG TPA: tripartite tricarboxylate transporter substrate binding protein [Burkholderiales bacterium]|nr:tripartite tricarboxylate transporter substrate binding protein [Burkholderiales bacterium]